MTDTNWEQYINKHCKVFCGYGICYHGKILSKDTYGIILHDKFGKDIFINFTTIRQIEVLE